MHAGTIGPKHVKNMQTAKNHLVLPTKNPDAKPWATFGAPQHAFVKMAVNGIPKQACVAHHHLTMTINRQPAHNLIWGHATWATDKKKNQQP